jgi:hypothetical protein
MRVKLSLALKEAHRLKVFQNLLLRRIFGPKNGSDGSSGENCILRSFIICTLHKIMLGKNRSLRYVARMGEMTNAIKMFGRK